eukprot:1066765-Amorphochlora_amoeboformis.AAC.1
MRIRVFLSTRKYFIVRLEQRASYSPPRPPTVMKPAWGLLEKEARVVALGFVVVLMTSADLVSVDCDRWDKGLGLAVIAGLDLGLGLGLGSGFGSEVIRVLRLLEAAGTWLLSYPAEEKTLVTCRNGGYLYEYECYKCCFMWSATWGRIELMLVSLWVGLGLLGGSLWEVEMLVDSMDTVSLRRNRL